jgi:hypothetical protein
MWISPHGQGGPAWVQASLCLSVPCGLRPRPREGRKVLVCIDPIGRRPYWIRGPPCAGGRHNRVGAARCRWDSSSSVRCTDALRPAEVGRDPHLPHNSLDFANSSTRPPSQKTGLLRALLSTEWVPQLCPGLSRYQAHLSFPYCRQFCKHRDQRDRRPLAHLVYPADAHGAAPFARHKESRP